MPLIVGNTWEYKQQDVWLFDINDSLHINVLEDTIFTEVTYRRIVEYEGFLLAVYYYDYSSQGDYSYLY